jgi:hypothetical protein
MSFAQQEAGQRIFCAIAAVRWYHLTVPAPVA